MPFFFVDDGFSSHPKVIRLRRGATRERAAGLWTLAGSWSSRHLTDGAIPGEQITELGCTKAAAQWLVDVGLWHEAGHNCPTCPQPDQGGYQFHQWSADGRNWTREQVLDRRAKKAAAGAAGGRASGRARRERSKLEAPAAAPASSSLNTHSHPLPSPPLQNHLVTLVCRRLAGDARDATTTDRERAELREMWAHVAGPDVDLDAELRLWLMRNAETDLYDPGAALVGWLRTARDRAATAAPLGCSRCTGGWLPDDVDTGRPVPCPDCRPHLQAVSA